MSPMARLWKDRNVGCTSPVGLPGLHHHISGKPYMEPSSRGGGGNISPGLRAELLLPGVVYPHIGRSTIPHDLCLGIQRGPGFRCLDVEADGRSRNRAGQELVDSAEKQHRLLGFTFS